MSITSHPMLIQEAYTEYKEGKFIVNRKYQRKLVWRIQEKQSLISSILRKYPIPLFLFARVSDIEKGDAKEIIDGMQRLNAIFSFIENHFSVDGKFFDVNQFLTAKMAAQSGDFSIDEGTPKLTPKECSDILNYPLSVTIYSANDQFEVTEVFGRINSGGKQLSAQEKRQAGVVNPFSETVKKIAAKLRGDETGDILLLQEMPAVSIDSKFEKQGYGVPADETIWVKQGILSLKQLRNSEDEQMIADIAASILLSEPLAASMDLFDKLYDEESEEYKKIENALALHSPARLIDSIEQTFSVLKNVIESYSESQNCLRQTIGQSQIKTPFYAIFMSFYNLVIERNLSPIDSAEIMESLKGVELKSSSKNTTTRDRRNNINKVKGLIQDYFVEQDPPVRNHGPGLTINFENHIRRSKIERPRYELKQGIVNLSPSKRAKNKKIIPSILETICGIANVGPDQEGYIFIGVTDKISDANKIENLDKIKPIEIPGSNRYVVGIEREANILGISLEEYVEDFMNSVRNSELSDTLRREITSGNIDPFPYKDLFVIKITVPPQKELSYFNRKVFVRDGSSTIELKETPDIVTLSRRFS
jgi:hypothetical protein